MYRLIAHNGDSPVTRHDFANNPHVTVSLDGKFVIVADEDNRFYLNPAFVVAFSITEVVEEK